MKWIVPLLLLIFIGEVSREVMRWIDDCDLFIFGYLVRTFAQNVLAREMHEQEIWVTGWANLDINVIERMSS